MSLIVWSLVMVVTLKYVLLVMRADNHGEGGIMALVALVAARRQGPRARRCLVLIGALRRGAALRRRHDHAGDLGAVGGRGAAGRHAGPRARRSCRSRWRSWSALFLMQRFGTGAVGALFGPIMAVWFVVDRARSALPRCSRHPAILRALSPDLRRLVPGARPAGWASSSLGAVVLAITGAEALYADMGHFGRAADPRGLVQRSCCPALVAQLLRPGRAAPRQRRATVDNPFFRLVPAWSQLPDGGARDGGDGDRLAGGDLGRVLADPAGGAARLPAARDDPAHVRAEQRADLRARGQLGPDGRRGRRWCSASAAPTSWRRRTASPSPARLRITTLLAFVVASAWCWRKPLVAGVLGAAVPRHRARRSSPPT